MEETITEEITEKIESVIDSRIFAVKNEMKSCIRQIFWDCIMFQQSKEMEYKKRIEARIDEMVDIVLDTAKFTDREDGENYTIHNEEKTKPIIEELKKLLLRCKQNE